MAKRLGKLLFVIVAVACALCFAPTRAFAQITFSIPDIRCSLPESGDGSDLIEGYIEQRFASELPQTGTPLLRGRPTLGLEGLDEQIYLRLKQLVSQAAAGSLTSTAFRIEVSDLYDHTFWTAEELGVDYIYDGGDWSQDAFDAAWAKVTFNLTPVLRALLADCPYELYWYDKTEGASASFPGLSAGYVDGEYRVGFPGGSCITVSMTVSANYAPNGQIGGLELDPFTGQRVSTAVATARGIANANTGLQAYARLAYFKDEICELTEYNYDAADDDTDTPYGDPWQLIYVFDGDDTTHVVCEGYSKAFQYLCDLANIPDVSCYSVTGMMIGGTGAGPHMWNLVNMDDGKVYLVDVTNCDEGSIGYPDELFIVPFSSGSVEGGYVFDAGGTPITYAYDADLSYTYSTADLTVSSEAYVVPEPTPEWIQLGTCEYQVSGDTLTIRPLDDGASGTLPPTNGSTLPGVSGSSVKHVVFEPGVKAGTSLNGAFANCSNLESIDFSDFDTSAVTDMSGMFYGCSSLTSIDVSRFMTSSVTLMDSTFANCTAVTGLDLASWETYAVTDMENMFYGCTSLRTIFVSELWSTASVYAGSQMFANCRRIRGGNGTAYSTQNVSAFYARVDAQGAPGYLTETTKPYISDAQIAPIDTQVYTGEAIRPTPVLTLDGAELVEGMDYRLAYDESVDAGYWAITIYGIGSYTGISWIDFEIAAADISDCEITFDAEEYTDDGLPVYDYFGHPVEPSLTITHNGRALVEGVDYDLECGGNEEPGIAWITVFGQGNFCGSETFDFSIVTEIIPISHVQIAQIADQDWTGAAVTPDLTLTFEGEALVEGDDYTVEYSDNVVPGTATVTITGMGAFTGTVSLTFDIVARNLHYAVVAPIADHEYTGQPIEPQIEVTLNGTVLERGVDYVVSYVDNTDAGTATVVVLAEGGFYTGTVISGFDIVPADLSHASVAGIADQIHSGSPIEPSPYVSYGQMTLTEGVDFTVEYANNTNVGTATVTITGMGNFTGTTSTTFEIVADVTYLATGKWGTCPWEITENGTLTVHPGQGANTGYFSGSPWSEYKDIITSIRFVAEGGQRVVASSYTSHLFDGLENVVSIDLSGFDFNSGTTMEYMFRGCSSLESVDLSGWDVSNVTDMFGMFNRCTSLTSVDLSYLDASRVTTMRCMFFACTSLTTVDLSGFKTSDLTDTSEMFYYCSKLTAVDLSSFDLSSVTDMSDMFACCNSLKSLALPESGTPSVTTMRYLFLQCYELEDVNVSALDTSSVTDMSGMFSDCYSLTELDLSGFDVSNVTKMTEMFYNDELTSINVSGWNTSAVTDMRSMFEACKFTSIDFSSWDTSNVTSMRRMFRLCDQLEVLDLSTWDTSNVTDMNCMFEDCFKLETVFVSDLWSTESVIDGDNMFLLCEELVGGNGFTYDYNCIVHGWACIDTPEWTGYFTSIDDKNRIDLRHAVFSEIEDQPLIGSAVEPDFTVTLDGAELIRDTDYTVSFTNNDLIGRATVTIKGIGNYRGVAGTTFWIVEYIPPAKIDISNAVISEIGDQQYTGFAIEPAFTVTLDGKELVEGTDYTVEYTNNVGVGVAIVTVRGTGDYEGYVQTSFEIVSMDLFCAIFSAIEDQTYTGFAITPEFTVTLGGRTLSAGTDYTVEYANNVEIGTATVTVRGAGDYEGYASTTFEIVAADISQTMASEIVDQTYTGNAIRPDVDLWFNGARLGAGTDYTLAYHNNTEVGTATIVVTGKGNFTGTKGITFEIVAGEEPVKTGWQQDADGDWVYYNGVGTLLTDGWASYSGKWYYFGDDGKLVWTGVSHYQGKYYYIQSGNVLTSAHGWKTYKGAYYYFNGSYASAYQKQWLKSGSAYYYFGADGKLIINGWVVYNGNYFYMGANATPTVNKWLEIDGAWYHFNASGICDRVG